MIEKLIIARLALISTVLALALTVNVALAHAGEHHGDQSASANWLGRLDEVGIAGGVLLAFGMVYWLSNRDRKVRQ